MGSASKRVWVVEDAVAEGPDGELHLTGEFDMERARVLLDRLLGTLAEVGGMFSVAADRVKVGEFNGQPLAQSRALIVEWQAFSPMREDDGAPTAPAPAGDAWDDDAEPEDEAERVADEQEAAVAELEGDEQLVVAGGDPWDADAPPETEEPDQS